MTNDCNLLIVSCSMRPLSQSRRVSDFLLQRLTQSFSVSVDIIDLSDQSIPYWEIGKEALSPPWDTVWLPVSKKLRGADGFVFVVPEWGGMVPPNLKNLFLLCDSQELAHKPALPVAVSDSTGGGHIIPELRSSSYKNTYICWTPVHIILWRVSSLRFEESIPERILSRVDDGLECLVSYTHAMATVRPELLKTQRNSYGQ